MMFPVNRPASELTVTELMNLHAEASAKLDHDTVRELRTEIERRMEPCKRQHYNWYQGQGQLLGHGSIAQQLAQSQLDPTRGGNR